MIKLRQVICEGVDLSGKSTLIQNVHKATKFCWNIHDRGELSMLCYSRLYDRSDTDYWRGQLKDFVNNLNNRMIILHPSWDTIKQRFTNRGDDIQDIVSLQKLYNIFEEEIALIAGYSTVVCINDSDTTNHIERLVERLNVIEKSAISDITREIQTNVITTSHLECSPINVTLTYNFLEMKLDSDFINDVFSCLSEESYYHKITSNVLDNINNELRGHNDYKLVQDINSRRFIYTDNSCISLIHSMVRDNCLNVYVTCRSTHVITKLDHDLKFLYFLTHRIHKHLSLNNNVPVKLHISLHSAHSF